MASPPSKGRPLSLTPRRWFYDFEDVWKTEGQIVTAKPLIGYLRVSTCGQGRSGLGIEAQRDAVARFAQAEGFEIATEFIEVETGKGADALDRRPQLAAALAEARPRAAASLGGRRRLSRPRGGVAKGRRRSREPRPAPFAQELEQLGRQHHIAIPLSLAAKAS
jgi:hypothetical protein